MQNLSSKHIIPNMEQKIRVLNQQVIFVCLNLLSETQHLILTFIFGFPFTLFL